VVFGGPEPDTEETLLVTVAEGPEPDLSRRAWDDWRPWPDCDDNEVSQWLDHSGGYDN
jgi:hypothetical protein